MSVVRWGTAELRQRHHRIPVLVSYVYSSGTGDACTLCSTKSATMMPPRRRDFIMLLALFDRIIKVLLAVHFFLNQLFTTINYWPAKRIPWQTTTKRCITATPLP